MAVSPAFPDCAHCFRSCSGMNATSEGVPLLIVCVLLPCTCRRSRCFLLALRTASYARKTPLDFPDDPLRTHIPLLGRQAKLLEAALSACTSTTEALPLTISYSPHTFACKLLTLFEPSHEVQQLQEGSASPTQSAPSHPKGPLLSISTT